MKKLFVLARKYQLMMEVSFIVGLILYFYAAPYLGDQVVRSVFITFAGILVMDYLLLAVGVKLSETAHPLAVNGEKLIYNSMAVACIAILFAVLEYKPANVILLAADIGLGLAMGAWGLMYFRLTGGKSDKFTAFRLVFYFTLCISYTMANPV